MKSFSNQLSKVEIKEINDKKINTYKGLIPILLKRVLPQNVDSLSSILKQSILSSISVKVNDEIEELFKEIGENTNLLFEKHTQSKIEKLIIRRKERDKEIITLKTSDISNLILEITEHFDEAISNSGLGIKNVSTIKEQIEAIKINENSLETILEFQNNLISVTSKLEEDMRSTNYKLESSKNQIQTLENKIKSLEDELTKTQTENSKDLLTGVLTRRTFNNVVKRIESAYSRLNTPYAVVFFDIDYFESINENYGYECGDTILSAFGKILSQNIREYDLVGRYSGSKFISIIYFNKSDELLDFLERIKKVINENSFEYNNQKLKITFSSGTAFRSSYSTYDDTLQEATTLLYKAKDTGRNKILIENGIEI